jgi:hypothetical protein
MHDRRANPRYDSSNTSYRGNIFLNHSIQLKLPDELKRKYKTPNGIVNYLQKQMQNWTGKHIKNTNSQ